MSSSGRCTRQPMPTESQSARGFQMGTWAWWMAAISPSDLRTGRAQRRWRALPLITLLLSALLTGPVALAAEQGETRCGAAGTVEKYHCAYGRCEWQNTYQRCANNTRAPACNVGDTKCSASGYVQYCQLMGSDTMWTGSLQRCATDRDPADNAPQGYGGYVRPNPYSQPSYGGGSSNGASQPRVCTPGQQECGSDRRIRSCVMQGGRPAWQTVEGSRCGSPSGMRN